MLIDSDGGANWRAAGVAMAGMGNPGLARLVGECPL